MTKPELFQNIDIILEYLYTHQRTRIIDFSARPEDKDLFKRVYKEVYPHVTPDLNCLQCLLDCMNNLLAWKTREYPRYLTSIEYLHDSVPTGVVPSDVLLDTYVEPVEEQATIPVVDPEILIEEKKPVKNIPKKKKSSRNRKKDIK